MRASRESRTYFDKVAGDMSTVEPSVLGDAAQLMKRMAHFVEIRRHRAATDSDQRVLAKRRSTTDSWVISAGLVRVALARFATMLATG